MQSEAPRFIDGLDLDFEERQVEIREDGYPDQAKKIELAPGLVLIREDDQPPPNTFFIQNNGHTIARIYRDHGDGIDLVSWKIDSNPETPLFSVAAHASRNYPRNNSFELGLTSRGVIHPDGSYGKTGFKVHYRIGENHMLISDPHNDLKPLASLSTTEPVTHEVQETEEQYILNLKIKNGVTEVLTFPKVLGIEHFYSLFWETNKNLFDPQMPYLNWQSMLGVTFSLKSSFGEMEQPIIQ